MPNRQRTGAFISYARVDGEDLARSLYERIGRELPDIGAKFDRVIMQGGVSWWAQLEEEINAAEVLVLIVTPGALQSDTVRREWRYARQQGVYVYPVNCLPAMTLQCAPRWMQKAHFYDLAKEWERFADALKVPRRAHRVPFMAAELQDTFVPRPQELQRLKALLLKGEQKDPIAITTGVHGTAGYGKTTIARALCHDEDVIEAYDDGILWVTLGQSPDLIAAVITLYAALTGERPGFAGLEDAGHSLAELLKDKNCLLVVDDIWAAAHLEPFLHAAKSCGLLVTTRQADVALRLKAQVKVDEMTTTEAAEMLSKGIDRATPAAFSEVARRLGEWPLLLALARGAIRRRIELGDSIEGAIAYVREALTEEGPGAFDEVKSSIGLTLRLLAEDQRRRFFELGVFHEDADIPADLVAALWGLSRYRTERELETLQNAGLIELDLARGIRLHDVFREYALRKLADVAGLHARLVDSWGDPGQYRTDYVWRFCSWHLKEAARTDELRRRLFDFDWISRKLEATDINSLIADYDHVSGDEARPVQEALGLSAHVLAKDSKQLATQLFGRLLDAKHSEIVRLLGSAKAWRGTAWLRPLTQSFAAPGGPLARTFVYTDTLWRVVVTPDGRRAISSSADSKLTVWDIDTGAALRSLDIQSALWAHALAITPDGRRVISVYKDNLLKAWDLDSGEEAGTFEGHESMVTGLAITPDGRRVISASFDETLKVWDLDSRAELRTLRGHTQRLSAVAVTPDGRRAVSASDDQTLKVWDLESGAELCTLRGHRHLIGAVAVTADGRRAISASEDWTLKLWDLEHGTELKTLSDHTGPVGAVAIMPDGQHAISASSDQTLKIWDLAGGAVARTLRGHTQDVCDVAVTSDGKRAISASMDNTLKVWSLQSDAGRRPTYGHQAGVYAVAVAAEACIAVSASQDRTIKVWDVDRGTELRTLAGHRGGVWNVALTPDGRHAISAGGDQAVKIWDLKSGTEVRSFATTLERITGVALTPDGRRAVVAGDKGKLTAWDVENSSEAPAFELQRGIECVLAPHGRWAIFRTGWIELFDLDTRQRIRKCAEWPQFVAASQDGRYALCCQTTRHEGGGLLEDLAVSDLESGLRLYTVQGAAHAKAVALTSEGGRAVLASYQELSCWDLKSGARVATLIPERNITACAVTSDGQTIVAGDDNGTVHFLRVEADA